MAVYDLKKEEDVKSYLQNVFTEYKFLCHHEKRPDGCHLLADFLETIRKDFKTAAAMFKSNCDDQKYGHSCLKYANMSYIGKGCEESQETALNYYKKGCELNNYKSCVHGGAILTAQSEKHTKDDYIEGLKLLEKGCDGRFGLSCYFMGCIYLAGSEYISKDLNKAFTLTKKACDLGIAQACANVSIMYTKGDGIDKNEKLANFYKERVKEIITPKKIELQQGA